MKPCGGSRADCRKSGLIMPWSTRWRWLRMAIPASRWTLIFCSRRRDLQGFHERLVGRGYVLAFPGALKTFRDAETKVKIEVLTSGEYPGDGKPKPVSFSLPALHAFANEDAHFLTLEKLIELKLASGMTDCPASHARPRGRARFDHRFAIASRLHPKT